MSVERIEVPASPEVIAAWKSHFGPAASEDTAGMLTNGELAALAGLSVSQMSKRLRAGVRDGTYICCVGRRSNAAGAVIPVPVYKLADQKPRGKKHARRTKHS